MDLKRLPPLFYRNSNGREPVREWLKELPPEDRRIIGEEFFAAMKKKAIFLNTSRGEIVDQAAQALARELEEELGIRGAAGPEIVRYEYTYAGRDPIRLFFFRVTEFQGEPTNVIFHEMRWEPAQSLGSFDFVEGDIEFLRGLISGTY